MRIMKQDFKNIAQNITTKSDLIFFLDQVDQARELVFKKRRGRLSKKTKGIITEELRTILKKQEQKGNLKTKEQQVQFLDRLKNYLKEIPQIKMVIAFSASNKFLKKIGNWLEDEIGTKVILDITVNPKIGGGIIIEYQGRYLNLSLAKKIDQLISSHQLLPHYE